MIKIVPPASGVGTLWFFLSLSGKSIFSLKSFILSKPKRINKFKIVKIIKSPYTYTFLFTRDKHVMKIIKSIPKTAYPLSNTDLNKMIMIIKFV